MKREDIQPDRVYQCQTHLPRQQYGNRAVVGLCKVVEIPTSGTDVLVRQVDGKLRPTGKSIAARLNDIRLAGDYDIERAVRETLVLESEEAWRKMANQVKNDYLMLLKHHGVAAKITLSEHMPYQHRHANPPTRPERITYKMIERTVTISIQGLDYVKSTGVPTLDPTHYRRRRPASKKVS